MKRYGCDIWQNCPLKVSTVVLNPLVAAAAQSAAETSAISMLAVFSGARLKSPFGDFVVFSLT